MGKGLIAFGVAGIIAAVVLWAYSQFMTPSKMEIPVTHLSAELTQVQNMSEGKPLDVPEIAGKKRPTEKTWGRDPFELSPGVKLRGVKKAKSRKAIKPSVKKKSAKAIEPPAKKVTAILITDSRKIASINHKVVTVGDSIDGEKVLEIKPDRVILEKNGKRKVIMLEESPVQWKKDKGKEHEK
jgi:type II secretory pathway component PulC